MSKGIKIFISTILTILVLTGISLSTIWNHRNTAVELEERITAQYTSNKSNYDNMWKKFKEMTQVTDIQAEKMKDVYKDLITGRNQDTKLLFKMIKEDNPQLDQSTFTNLQNEIASSRNTFDNNQKQITDIVREYNTYVRKCIVMSAITGRTPKNPNDFIITSARTDKAFETKQDDVINLK